MNAIHDGSVSQRSETKMGNGLQLDALHDVTATQGWIGKMTQMPDAIPEPSGAFKFNVFHRIIDVTLYQHS